MGWGRFKVQKISMGNVHCQCRGGFQTRPRTPGRRAGLKPAPTIHCKSVAPIISTCRSVCIIGRSPRFSANLKSYGLAAGMAAGLATVVTRHLRARQDSRTIYAFQCFVGTLFSIPFVAREVRFPGMAEGTLLLILAVFGLLAQVIMN